MKLGEVVVTHMYYNFTKFHQNQMKKKKVLLIARFSVQNFKVSLELWKSYIVSASKNDSRTEKPNKGIKHFLYGKRFGSFLLNQFSSSFSNYNQHYFTYVGDKCSLIFPEFIAILLDDFYQYHMLFNQRWLLLFENQLFTLQNIIYQNH